MLRPSQRTHVLIKPEQSPGRYHIVAQAYASAQADPFDNTITTIIIEYNNNNNSSTSNPVMPPLPAYNDTATVTDFTTSRIPICLQKDLEN